MDMLNTKQRRLREALSDTIGDCATAESIDEGVSIGDVIIVLQNLESKFMAAAERATDAEFRGEEGGAF